MIKTLVPPPLSPLRVTEAEAEQVLKQRERADNGYYLTDNELGLLHEVILSFGTNHHTHDYYRLWQERLEKFRDQRMHPHEPCYCGNNCTCGG